MISELRFVIGSWHVVVSTHAAAVAIAVVVGALVAARRAPRPGALLACAPVLAAAVLAGSHLLYHARHGGAFDLRHGGLASMGGVVGLAAGIALAAMLSAMRIAVVADAVAPAALLGLGIGRIGCFLAGCCVGLPTALPWGVVFPDLGVPARHPLQLYAAAVDLGLALALCRTAGPPGMTAARTMAAFGAARLCLELLRDPLARDPVVAGVATAQLGAALLVVAGLLAMRRVRHRVALPRRSPGG